MQIVYLDNCCYNRPFDDRSNIKNYLEREAVLIVMQMAFDEQLIIIGSQVLEKEMSLISDMEKRSNVESLYEVLTDSVIELDDQIVQRAGEIMNNSSLKAFDSLHLACAEAKADILLTTDAKFLKAANRFHTRITVKNPIDFLMEVTQNDNDDEFEKKQ